MNFHMNVGKYLNVTIVPFIKKHLKKIRKENQKNRDCQAKIEILIKLSTKDTKKKDVYVKVNIIIYKYIMYC